MSTVAIVGDGPGGLSAALFLAKNGHEATVYGKDETAVHFAYLRNYLGVPDILGSDFQEVARSQAAAFGAHLVDDRVSAVEATDSGFALTLESGATARADYLILSEGKRPELCRSLGLDVDDSGTVVVDGEQRTSLPRVYAVGRSTRPTRSQAIISAGAVQSGFSFFAVTSCVPFHWKPTRPTPIP